MQTAVSVVMAAYNGARFLRQQLDSVTSQLEPGDELLVVDDASTDETAKLLAENPVVRTLRNPTNLGVIKTFERGLLEARHDIVFLCDQDDVWLPDKRRSIVAAFAASPEVSVVLSDAQIIDERGTVTAPSFMVARGGFSGGLWATLYRNRYLGCTMALRRRVIVLALPFPSGIPMHDMWLGLIASSSGRVRYLAEPLIQYRRHSANVSPARHRSLTQMMSDRFRLFVRIVPKIARLRLRAVLDHSSPPKQDRGS